MILFHLGKRLAMLLLCPPLKIFGRIFCIGIIFEYCVHIVYLTEMKPLSDTLYKEHCDLYTKIHGSIAVNGCQIELAQEDIILLSKVSIIVYRAGKRTGVENNKFIPF